MNQGEQFKKDEPLYTNPFQDEQAFELFFKENYVPLCARCQYRFGFEQDIAKEIVHTAFIKLWENRQRISPGRPALNYLYTIIYNNSLDTLKHDKVRHKYQQYVLSKNAKGEAESSFEDADIKQLAADIDKAIAALPEKMREIFVLNRYEGMKYAAIADLLNISVKTVETQMSRALARLREELSRYLLILILTSAINFTNLIYFMM